MPPWFSLAFGAAGLASGLAFVISAAVIVVTVYLLNEAVQALRRSEARASSIAREMQHRVKNALQVVQSISTMTVGDASSAKDHQTKLNDRISAFAQALEAPRPASHLPVDLHNLLSKVLQPFDASRFAVFAKGSEIVAKPHSKEKLERSLHLALSGRQVP